MPLSDFNIITDPDCPPNTMYLLPTSWRYGQKVKLIVVGNELHRTDWDGNGKEFTRPLTDEEKKYFAVIKNIG